MLSALFGSSPPVPKLRVVVPSLLFTHCPPLDRVVDVREGNALLAGSVELELPAAADHVVLTVALIGTAKTKRHGSYEVLRAGPLRLDVGSLGAGSHTFAFTLDVPLSSPPTERCDLGSIDYAVIATGLGLGPSGKDVVATEPLVVNAIPSSEGQPPPGIDAYAEGVNEDFGAWKLMLRSALLSVGGILAFSFQATEQPRSIATMGYEVDLVQTIEARQGGHDAQLNRAVHRRPEPDLGHALPAVPDRGRLQVRRTSASRRLTARRDFKNAWARTLSGMESQPAKATLRVEKGVVGPDGQPGLTLVFMDIEGAEGRPSEFDVVRLPADNSIRASTPRGTLTPFRISHKIELGYLYSTRSPDRQPGDSGLTPTTPKRRFNIKRVLHLAPCVRLSVITSSLIRQSCLRGNVTLPTYDQVTPASSKGVKTAALCVCQAAMPDVVAEQGACLSQRGR